MKILNCICGCCPSAGRRAVNRRGVLGALVALSSALLLIGCVHAGARPGIAAATDTPAPITAMTFNIRLDLPSDGANAWSQRKELVFELIRREAPDLLGMQEVLLHQKRELEAALPDYAMIGAGRDDGREAGEFSPLAWRRDRFELVRSGTFWLSPTPETPGKACDVALPRIATWAVLRDRKSGETLRVLNTHFDHVGAVAKANSARLIGEWVKAGPDAGLPAIVMGDFNSPTGSEPYRLLADTGATSLSRCAEPERLCSLWTKGNLHRVPDRCGCAGADRPHLRQSPFPGYQPRRHHPALGRPVAIGPLPGAGRVDVSPPVNRSSAMLFALLLALTSAGCATTHTPPLDRAAMRSVTELPQDWEFAYNDEWSRPMRGPRYRPCGKP